MCFLYTFATNIISDYRADHRGVTLELTLNENERGRMYWKFNNSLLKYHNYIQIVKYTISNVKQTYVANNREGNLVNQQSEYSIND